MDNSMKVGPNFCTECGGDYGHKDGCSRKRRKLYDSKCYDLAWVFLSDCNLDTERMLDLADQLAMDIQQTIEDFISFEVVS